MYQTATAAGPRLAVSKYTHSLLWGGPRSVAYKIRKATMSMVNSPAILVFPSSIRIQLFGNLPHNASGTKAYFLSCLLAATVFPSRKAIGHARPGSHSATY